MSSYVVIKMVHGDTHELIPREGQDTVEEFTDRWQTSLEAGRIMTLYPRGGFFDGIRVNPAAISEVYTRM